ncbi:MAG: hypothetical protein H7Z14_17440 [Anaerolineae bacterium]|nr:hypothetical protein [Phycisphaerae bacterium]
MDGKLRRHFENALAEVDERRTRGPRLVDDAQRLFARVQKFISLKLIANEPDLEALELACWAMQLPQKQTAATVGKLARSSVKQRAEQSAELLVTLLSDHAEEDVLDRTTRLLLESPQRQPMIEEARLLGDAISLEDFGLTGLTTLMIQLALQGNGVNQLIESYEKRDAYGYWDARLKEGFHFNAVRAMAKKRLEHARSAAAALMAEVKDDQP